MPPVPLHFVGKANPMTAITPVPRGWRRLVTHLILFVFRRLSLGVVRKLAFIHFARWILIRSDKLPRLDPNQPVEDWPYDLYLFTTNFNGSWDQYIDAFGRIKPVSKGLNLLWCTSAGFPGPWPMRLFKRYISYFEHAQDLYYNAYPGATVRDIDAALQLDPILQAFLDATEKDIDDAEFGRRYRAFVNEAAPCLGKTGLKAEHAALGHTGSAKELHS